MSSPGGAPLPSPAFFSTPESSHYETSGGGASYTGGAGEGKRVEVTPIVAGRGLGGLIADDDAGPEEGPSQGHPLAEDVADSPGSAIEIGGNNMLCKTVGKNYIR